MLQPEGQFMELFVLAMIRRTAGFAHESNGSAEQIVSADVPHRVKRTRTSSATHPPDTTEQARLWVTTSCSLDQLNDDMRSMLFQISSEGTDTWTLDRGALATLGQH